MLQNSVFVFMKRYAYHVPLHIAKCKLFISPDIGEQRQNMVIRGEGCHFKGRMICQMFWVETVFPFVEGQKVFGGSGFFGAW